MSMPKNYAKHRSLEAKRRRRAAKRRARGPVRWDLSGHNIYPRSENMQRTLRATKCSRRRRDRVVAAICRAKQR